MRSACLAVAVAVVLAGCGVPPRLTTGVTPPDPPPVPRRKPDYQGPPTGTAVAVEGLAAGPTVPQVPKRHVVVPGDTVFRISRGYGIPIRSLIDANGLRPPYHLRPGQQLTVPALRLHVVGPGDTVYGIARRYRLAITELVSLNEIAPPFRIALGQQLVLPNPVEPPVTAQPPPVEPQGPSETPGSSALPVQTVDGVPVPRRKPTPGAAAPRQAASVPKAQKRGPIPEPPPRAASRFLWPVKGEITLGFGPKGGGLHNDGINISAPAGAPILAAENGVVAYAGNELRGFGNLLLIKHAKGWVTAYAHAEALLVGRGETVKRGQTIARVGSSGAVSAPQLHFEVRKGAETVDPLRYLDRRAAAAS